MPPSDAAPVEGDHFVAADPPETPAADPAAALAHQAAGFGASPSGQGTESTAAAQESDEGDVWEMAKRALYPVALRALGGDTEADRDLTHLAAGSDVLAGPARAILSFRGGLAEIVLATTPDEFERRSVKFTHRLLVTVAQMGMRGAAHYSTMQVAAFDFKHGPVLFLEEVAHGRFGSDQSPAARRLRHDVFGSPGTAMMLVHVTPEFDKMMDYFQAWAEFDPASRLLRDRAVMATLAAGVQGAARGVAIDIDLPAALEFAAHVEVTEVDLILGELATNAVKYSDRARAPQRIAVWWDPAVGALIVEDNGMGIADIARIWEDGFREAERHPGVPGTGTGLWSLHQRIEALGWAIEVESQVNVGTRFTITPKAGDVVEGTPPNPAAGGGGSAPAPGGAFGGVVETGGSKSGGEGEGAASAEPLENSDPAAVLGAEALVGADAVSAAIVGVPPPPTLVK